MPLGIGPTVNEFDGLRGHRAGSVERRSGFGLEISVESWIEVFDLSKGELPVERNSPTLEVVGLGETSVVVADRLDDELMVVDNAGPGSLGPAEEPPELEAGEGVDDPENAAECSGLEDDGLIEADLTDDHWAR